MSRTKGARDKAPRQMHAASLAVVGWVQPGYVSVRVRVYGVSSDMRWFASLSSAERGELVSRWRRHEG